MGGEKFTPCKRNRSQSSWEINVGDEETEVDALWFTWATQEAEAGEGLRLGWPDVQNSAQKMWNLRQHLWLEWTGLSGSGLGRWRVGGGLHWEGLALGLGRPGESLHCLCSTGAIPSLSRPFPDFHWVLL